MSSSVTTGQDITMQHCPDLRPCPTGAVIFLYPNYIDQEQLSGNVSNLRPESRWSS